MQLLPRVRESVQKSFHVAHTGGKIMLTSGNAFASHFGSTEFDSQSVPTIPIQASHSFSKYIQVHAGITLLSRIPKLILIIQTYLESTVHTSELGGPRTAMRRKPEIRPPASHSYILFPCHSFYCYHRISSVLQIATF